MSQFMYDQNDQKIYYEINLIPEEQKKNKYEEYDRKNSHCQTALNLWFNQLRLRRIIIEFFHFPKLQNLLTAMKASEIFCKVGQDPIGSGSFYRKQTLIHGSIIIQPSIPSCCVDHGILPTYIIGCYRKLG